MHCVASLRWPLVLFLCASLAATGLADVKDSQTYFPTKVGTKWVYSYDGKDETEEITAVEKKDESLIVTVRRVDGFGKKSDSQLKVSKEGLFRLTGGPAVTHPPMWLLKLPHKEGAKWKTFTGAFGMLESEVTAHGPEKVDVPAGKFEAIRIETQYPDKAGDDWIVGRCWYSRGVGLVKRTHGDYVRVLKSFTPGKD